MAKLSSTDIYGDLYVDGIISGVLGNTYTRSSVGHLDWPNNQEYLLTKAAIAHWNGRYDASNSNLAYCNRGAFGTIVTKNTGDYATASHTHASITAATGASWTSTAASNQTDCLINFYSHISQSAAGLFPRSNNANAMISINKHSGHYDSQLGFSSNGNVYYRSVNGTAMSDSTAWKQIAFTDSNITGKAANSDKVGGYSVWVGTQADYNAITSKSSTTLYYIKE